MGKRQSRRALRQNKSASASAEPGVLRMAVLKTDRVLFSQRYISAGGNIVAARRRENRRQKRLRLKRYWIQDYGIHDIVFVELVA